ncbi:MAG: hypothetical protein KF744_11335 [Taibaiella sp.]|nr:hypothetical protein [Taibaiella sp.]
MKSISYLLCALLCCAFGIAHAQVVTKGSHHIYLGYVPASSVKLANSNYIAGPLVAGYRYALGRRITLGAEVGYAFGDRQRRTYTFNQPNNVTAVFDDGQKYKILTTGVRADFHYINRSRLDVYSGLSIDGNWVRQVFDVHSAYNHDYGVFSLGVCVAGFRYMFHPKLGVYGELTMREMGNGVLGVSAKLGK